MRATVNFPIHIVGWGILWKNYCLDGKLCPLFATPQTGARQAPLSPIPYPLLHSLVEFAQIRVHWAVDAI